MRPLTSSHHLIALLFFTLPLAGLADTPGSLTRASELKEKPYIDAATLAKLPENTTVSVVANQGGWSQIRTKEGNTGWVRLLNINLGKTESAKGAGETVREIGGVIRTGTTKSAATTGAKGLSKEDIANARPNPAEVKKLESFKPTATDIDHFAENRKLKSIYIQDL